VDGRESANAPAELPAGWSAGCPATWLAVLLIAHCANWLLARNWLAGWPASWPAAVDCMGAQLASSRLVTHDHPASQLPIIQLQASQQPAASSQQPASRPAGSESRKVEK